MVNEAAPSTHKDTVAFVYVEDGTGQIQEHGTAFFLGVPTQDGASVSYLVTAKHIVMKPNGRFYDKIYLRLNDRRGGLTVRTYHLYDDQGCSAITHPDSSVDIAVLKFGDDLRSFGVQVMSSDMITTQDMFREMEINEGEEMFFTGLFIPFTGERRNYPIVRFGRLAMLTGEKIPWEGESAELYLMESQSFGGNSGAPVFFYLGPIRPREGAITFQPRILLAGVLKGSFRERKKVGELDPEGTAVYFQNLGISAVVPAYQLREILFSPELEEARLAAPLLYRDAEE
jgi:hypothetical protein